MRPLFPMSTPDILALLDVMKTLSPEEESLFRAEARRRKTSNRTRIEALVDAMVDSPMAPVALAPVVPIRPITVAPEVRQAAARSQEAKQPRTKRVYQRGDEFTPVRKEAAKLAAELAMSYHEVLADLLDPDDLAKCLAQASTAKGRWVEVPA